MAKPKNDIIYYAEGPFTASHWEALVEKQHKYPLGTIVRYTDGSYMERCRRPNVKFGWLRRFRCVPCDWLTGAKSSDGFVDVVRCAICGTETTFESPFRHWKAAALGW